MESRPKRIERLIRQWAGIAHDRELRKALGELWIQFGQWERGEIGSFELNDFIHQFHDGVSREIWKKYASRHVEPALASAVAVGIIKKEELPSELLQDLARQIDFYESDNSRS